jgi:hypothetical protein
VCLEEERDPFLMNPELQQQSSSSVHHTPVVVKTDVVETDGMGQFQSSSVHTPVHTPMVVETNGMGQFQSNSVHAPARTPVVVETDGMRQFRAAALEHDFPIQVQTPNPKKAGSASWRRYECYAAAKTLKGMLALGATMGDVKHDVLKRFITFPSHQKELSTEKVEASAAADDHGTRSFSYSSSSKRSRNVFAAVTSDNIAAAAAAELEVAKVPTRGSLASPSLRLKSSSPILESGRDAEVSLNP